MPHYTCFACRTRRRLSEQPPEMPERLCPDCGSLLEPISEFNALMEFRAVGGADRGTTAAARGHHEAVVSQIRQVAMRRRRVRARLDHKSKPGDEPQTASAALPTPSFRR